MPLSFLREAALNRNTEMRGLGGLAGKRVVANGDGWLQISTEGFASFNQSRPPGHLVRELVQNAFDALGDAAGSVSLSYRHYGSAFLVECQATGSGIHDLSAMRLLYLTFKT